MENKKITIMVGMFVGLGSILVFVMIILLGQENSLFESTTTLYIAFEDVGGLKPGSQVRLAGVGIGVVDEIEFSHALSDKKLHVEIKVRTEMMPRIRKDSVATVATKGLLGDKLIDISIGSSDLDVLKEDDYLTSEEPIDMFQILEQGGALVTHGAEIAKKLKVAINKFTDDKMVEHVKGIVESIDNVLNEVKEGKGVIHSLVYDSSINSDLKTTMANLKRTSINLNKTMIHIENVMNEVRSGKGTVHGLIYDEDGKKIVSALREASETIAEVITAVRDGNGMLHTIIYEEDAGNIIRNLDDATLDIKKLTAYIESGQGTIGMLIKDPTVFEDLKLILGNLKRNVALKALIRMSLERSEQEGISTTPGPNPLPQTSEENSGKE